MADPQAYTGKVAWRRIAFELEAIAGQAVECDVQALGISLELMFMGGLAKQQSLWGGLVTGEQTRAQAI